MFFCFGLLMGYVLELGEFFLNVDYVVLCQVYEFGKCMVDGGFMVMMGVGSGVMGAVQYGVGCERSFGFNIWLFFE